MARTAPRSISNETILSFVTEQYPSKTPQDVNFSTEVTDLVSSVGSAEVVIAYLLKEKKLQSAQNSQLWRLVDKQRAMILGLNKDLERALKDKERYRRKVREMVVQTFTTAEPVNSNEKLISHGQTENEVTNSSYIGIREGTDSIDIKRSDENVPKSPNDLVLVPQPLQPKPRRFNHQRLLVGDEDQADNKAVIPVVPNNQLPKIGSPTHNLLSKRSRLSVTEKLIGGSEESTENKGVISSQRKAPPASLDLGSKSNSRFRIQSAPDILALIKDDQDKLMSGNDASEDYHGRRKVLGEQLNRASSAVESGESRNSLFRNIMTESLNESAQGSNYIKDIEPILELPKRNPETLTTGTSLELLPTPIRTSLFPSFHVVTGLPVNQRPLKIADSPTQSICDPMNKANSSPVSLMFDKTEAPISPLSSPTALVQKTLSLPRTPVSTKSIENLRQESHSPISPKTSSSVRIDPKNTLQNKNFEGLDDLESRDGIYKGFIAEEYPDLLLPPSALVQVNVKVASSRMKPSRASIMFPKNTEDDLVFTLALLARSDNRELWRVEKDFMSLTLLDQTLKENSNYNAKFPDRSLFSGHAPAKVDARRDALNYYLEAILKIQFDIVTALNICKYLSSNAFGVSDGQSTFVDMTEKALGQSLNKSPGEKPLKNGYLTKRGKNFGGWKARYFVLDGPVLHYFESPSGSCLGAIKLQNAQIGKQSQPNEKNASTYGENDESEGKYRHAFLILEPRKKDSSGMIRHVLCAESDLERDQWVDALCQYITHKDQTEKTSNEKQRQMSLSSSKYKIKAPSKKNLISQGSKESLFRGVSYENTKANKRPLLGQKNDSYENSSPIGRESSENLSRPQSPKIIPKLLVGQGQDGCSNKQQMSFTVATEIVSSEKTKPRKRSFFSFGTKTKVPTESPENGGSNTPNSLGPSEQQSLTKNAFGASLADAVKYNRHVGVNTEIPAVVFRCVEYLDVKNAFHEEGIFRLSGSNLVIKKLRERFNSEGDVNLVLDDEFYDIHAVASLLKLYLRELPSTILTRQLHADFLAVIKLPDLDERIGALHSLVSKLPSENRAILRYLTSFLIKIIDNSDVNKMTVRNVGIVFAPTLNIPASVFSLFLQQYSKIFDMQPDYRSASIPESSNVHSSNKCNTTQVPSATNDREQTRAASKLAGSTFIKSIGASKTYQQNIIETETLPGKMKRRDSSLFGMNVPNLGQHRGSMSRSSVSRGSVSR